MFKHRRARSIRALGLSAALLISACAGTKVADVKSSSIVTVPALPRSVAVMVENNSTPPRNEEHRARQLADARQASAALAEGLSQILAERHLVVVSEGQRPDLILRCSILDVRGGNTPLRVIIGYGAGKAILKVHVTLTEAAVPGQPLLAFDVNSTTGRAPGAYAGLASGSAAAAGGAALGVPGHIKQGLAKELAKTTEQVDDQLGKYFTAQKWPYTKPDRTPDPPWKRMLSG